MRLSGFLAGFLGLAYIPYAQADEHAQEAASRLPDIPSIGFGTWNLDPKNASNLVAAALRNGYRHIDCAAIYGNEEEVGRGIRDGAREAGLKREQFWITSKLWNDHHRPDLVPQALEKTLKDLNLEYLDLYLMHWPVGDVDGETQIDYVDTWRAMSQLLSSGKTRYIGVSNFSPSQMAAIIPISKPYAHQFETHPYLQQADFIKWHQDQGIHVTAYSPLGNQNSIYTSWRKQVSGAKVPQLLQNPVMKDIGRKRGCTPAQVALKWGLLRGTSVIPKSKDTARIAENLGSLDCALLPEDSQAIAMAMPVKRFNNPSNSWNVRLYDGLQDAGGLVDTMQSFVATWVNKISSSLENLWLNDKDRKGEL